MNNGQCCGNPAMTEPCPVLKQLDHNIAEQKDRASSLNPFRRFPARKMVQLYIEERAAFQQKIKDGDCPGVIYDEERASIFAHALTYPACGVELLEVESQRAAAEFREIETTGEF